MYSGACVPTFWANLPSPYSGMNCNLFSDHKNGCRRFLRNGGRGQLKCDDTRAETRFRLSAKRTSPFNRRGRQFSRLLAAEVCASAVVMLDTPCSEVVWRVLATLSIRQFPLHFPSRASPCAMTFQLESNYLPEHTASHWRRRQPPQKLLIKTIFIPELVYKMNRPKYPVSFDTIFNTS